MGPCAGCCQGGYKRRTFLQDGHIASRVHKKKCHLFGARASDKCLIIPHREGKPLQNVRVMPHQTRHQLVIPCALKKGQVRWLQLKNGRVFKTGIVAQRKQEYSAPVLRQRVLVNKRGKGKVYHPGERAQPKKRLQTRIQTQLVEFITRAIRLIHGRLCAHDSRDSRMTNISKLQQGRRGKLGAKRSVKYCLISVRTLRQGNYRIER